jgi:predicted deacylase
MAQGLLGGDLAGAAQLAAGVEAGVPGASTMLRALHSAMLAFNARCGDALEAGQPLVDNANKRSSDASR